MGKPWETRKTIGKALDWKDDLTDLSKKHCDEKWGWELIDSQVDTENLLNLGWLREYDGYTTIDYSILYVNMNQRSHHCGATW